MVLSLMILKNLTHISASIDANGIDFYDSIHDVPERDKEVIKRYMN